MKNRIAFAVAVCAGSAAMSLADAPAWRRDADARIEKIRKSDYVLTLTDAAGRPLAGREVTIQQTRSAFGFGTTIHGDPTSPAPHEVRYRRFITDHFNMLVCEDHMKWYSTEKQRDVEDYRHADAQAKFAHDHNLDLRGHCIFWSKPKFVQAWVQQLSDDDLRSEVDERIESVVGRYKGKLVAWDVNNEMLDGSFYKDRLGDAIRPHMFKKAREVDPKTPLFVNEYGLLSDDKDAAAKTQRYIELIKALQKGDAPVGGIGIQEHASERMVLNAAEAGGDDGHVERSYRGGLNPYVIWDRLDALGQFGLPIHITEVSAKTDDVDKRADALEALFRTMYAHEKVEAVLLWGFWARRHWLGQQACLVEADGTLNEAGRRITTLLLEEWRTRTTATTDAEGRVRFRGFHGAYRIGAGGLQAAVDLGPKNTAPTVALQAAPAAAEADR